MRTLGAEMEEKVNRFQAEHQALSDQLINLQDKHKETYEKMVTKYTNAASTFTRLEDDFMYMKKKYEKFIGLQKVKADELRAEAIDLPQNVDDLQFLCLQLREELIDDRAAREHLIGELQDELEITKQQLEEERLDKQQIISESNTKFEMLSEEISKAKNKVCFHE